VLTGDLPTGRLQRHQNCKVCYTTAVLIGYNIRCRMLAHLGHIRRISTNLTLAYLHWSTESAKTQSYRKSYKQKIRSNTLCLQTQVSC